MAEDPAAINNGAQEPRYDVDVTAISELEVDRTKLIVRNLRVHVSVLAELTSLVSL